MFSGNTYKPRCDEISMSSNAVIMICIFFIEHEGFHVTHVNVLMALTAGMSNWTNY